MLLVGLNIAAAQDHTARFARVPDAASATASLTEPDTRIAGHIEPAVRAPRRERFHWRAALLQSAAFLGMQHAGNLAMDYWIRYAATHGRFFSNYRKSLEGWRWTVWNDGDPFLDNYVGHPMMGAVTAYIQIQNDPGGRALRLEKSRAYINSRLKAFAWASAYSAQWKVGPLSEASIGNVGSDVYYSRPSHGFTNGTGMVDFVMTPVGGMVWLVGEDALDRYGVGPTRSRVRNRFAKAALSILTPCRSGANVLRLKAPWYRDYEPGALVNEARK